MQASRRRFLKTSAAATAASFAATPLLAAPGKKYRTAIIGAGWWGMNILRDAMAHGQCKMVGICDVSEQTREVSAEEITDLNGDQPRKYNDFREMLGKEKPEIVIIATPDHWHALPAIAAIEAGAHVFLEKPTAHTVEESRAILNAARAAKRVVQVGLHRRIGPHHVEAMKFLKSGKVGKVGQVRLFVTGGGGKEEPTPNSPAPMGMDWDLWCGPAPKRPFNRRLHPGGWRHFLDYANGTLGDWGVHWLDQITWWSDEKFPKRVFSSGGRPVRGAAVNDGEAMTSDTPDSQVAIYDYEDFTVTWEHRRFAMNATEHHRYGAYFYGTEGILHIGWRDGWTFYPAKKNGMKAHGDPRFDNERDGHNLPPLWADFMKAIADPKHTPAADIEPAHRSSVLPMLGMISYRLGRSLQWDGDKEQILNDQEANQLLRRDYRNPWVYPKV